MAQTPVVNPGNDLSRMLVGVGLALIGYYPVNVAIVLIPTALLQPAWLLRAADGLINSAFLPLLGLVLMVLASRFSDRPAASKLTDRFRRLAVAATIGFVLLAPLQTMAAIMATRADITTTTVSIAQAEKDLAQLAAADTMDKFRVAVRRLPPNVQQRMGRMQAEDFQSLRDQTVDLLRPQLLQARSNNKTLTQQRWLNAMATAIRASLLALLMALGFASVATPAAGSPTLLTGLLTLRQTMANRRQRKAAASTAAAARAPRRQSPEEIARWKEAQRQAADRQARAARNPRAGAPARPRPGAAQSPSGGLFGGKGRGNRGSGQGRVAPEWFEGSDETPKDPE